MTRILHIFKKDVAHLKAQILAFVVLLFLFAVHDSASIDQAGFLLNALLLLACWLLVTSLVQDEKAVGDAPYWLTRPFTRRDLLIAKSLFLVAFVIAPTFYCQAHILSLNGLSNNHLLELAEKQFFFLALILLPFAAVAAFTRNLKQACLGGLLLVAIDIVAAILRATAANGLGAAVAFCGSAAVIYLQYTRRRPALSWAAALATVAIFLAVQPLPPWQRSHTPRIFFDPRPAELPHAWSNGRSGDRYLVIPIRLDNLPNDDQVYSMKALVEYPWFAGWSADWGLSRDGRGWWLTVKIEGSPPETIRLVGKVDLLLPQEHHSVEATSPGFSPLGPPNPRTQTVTIPFDLGPLRVADYRVTAE